MNNMASMSIRLNPVGVIVLTVCIGCALVYIFDLPKLFKCETKVDLKEMLSIGIELAERGGKQVKLVREKENSKMKEEVKGKTKEGVLDVKTEGDMKSHREMTYGFRKMYPELKDNLISEEHETEPADLSKILSPSKTRAELKDLKGQAPVPISDVTVWIDPLDATKEYTENLINYVATMVCVAVKGVPRIGIVHFPFSGKTYWGLVGSGHSSNIKLVQPKDQKGDKTYSVTISRSHTGTASEVIKKSLGNKTEIILAAGAGFKTMQVVNGEADAYVHVTNIKKWDLCAGSAIIHAANGKMTTLDGSDIMYTRSGYFVNERGVLATLRDHSSLLSKIKPNFVEMKKTEQQKRKRATEGSPLKSNQSGTKSVKSASNQVKRTKS